MSQNPSQPIPLNTVLGERYKVTAAAVETADGDAVLEGKDQVLNRSVSIVVSAPHHNDRLITNARTMATTSRSNIQILDLGNTDGRAYLITSHTRADTLLNNLLADSEALAASSETQEALGQELLGEDETAGKTGYGTPAAAASSISATRTVETDNANAAPDEAAYSDYKEYDEYPEEQDFDDERRRGGVWVVATAAIILLAIGVAVVFSNLNGMVDQEASNEAAGLNNSSSASPSASTSPAEQETASPSPTDEKKAEPKFGAVTRIVPSNQNFMADQDSALGHLTDGNDSTTWISSGFGSANFGGAIQSFALSFELEEETTVQQLTIKQTSGSGGAFRVLVNDSASLEGATEVGSGSFDSATVTVDLDESAQGEGVKYVLVEFTEAPMLSQPIVAGYPYGTRINEVSASN